MSPSDDLAANNRGDPGLPTVGTALQHAAARLRAAGVEGARTEALLLLVHATTASKASLLAHPDRPLRPSESERFNRAVERRAAREPFAYIVGEREFYGVPFRVDQRVLIPRPETEVLVEEALSALADLRSSSGLTNPWVVDVGTGSGAIACAVAAHASLAPALHRSRPSDDRPVSAPEKREDQSATLKDSATSPNQPGGCIDRAAQRGDGSLSPWEMAETSALRGTTALRRVRATTLPETHGVRAPRSCQTTGVRAPAPSGTQEIRAGSRPKTQGREAPTPPETAGTRALRGVRAPRSQETAEPRALRGTRALRGERAGAEGYCPTGVASSTESSAAQRREPEQPRIIAVDRSADALDVAASNVDRLGLGDRVQLVRGDLLAWLREPVHLILANLPYIPSGRVPTLMPEVARYEPALALDGGSVGDELMRRLIDQAERLLAPGGTLLLEMDPEQIAPLAASVSWGIVRSIDDLTGSPRVLRIDRPR